MVKLLNVRVIVFGVGPVIVGFAQEKALKVGVVPDRPEMVMFVLVPEFSPLMVTSPVYVSRGRGAARAIVLGLVEVAEMSNTMSTGPEATPLA